MNNNDNESKKALPDAERRYRTAFEKHLELLARVRDAGESNTIPASYNDEWCETCDEVQAALAALNRIVDSILGFR